jgi:Fe-S-cluster containining protein
MKDFEFYKIIRLAKNNSVKKAFQKLNNIYKTVPDTVGCMDNICLKGKECCNAWCCRLQTPQLLYSEFLLIWDYVSKNWNDDDICSLLEKCMLNAINEIPSKGCVFLNEDNNLCKIHEQRPFNCRIYGITPDEEFNPRYEKLKKEYKMIKGAVAKPQCDLISVVGEKVTTDDTKKWWDKIVDVDKSIGIPIGMINDEMGGSYRSCHDHVLLYNLPENVLNSLAGIKMYPDFSDRIKAVKDIIICLRNYFKSISNDK